MQFLLRWCGYDNEKYDCDGDGQIHDHTSIEELILSTFNGFVGDQLSRLYGDKIHINSSEKRWLE